MSNSQLFPQSFAAYEKTIQSEKLSTNVEYNLQVKRVGGKIQSAVEKFFTDIKKPEVLEGYKWDYNVLESEQLNAWCMPGGKVAFYTGILPVCKNDVGVAVVMGHEIAHAIANHGAERMSQSQLQGTIGALGAAAMGINNVSNETINIVLQTYGVGSELGMLSYSRKHESEADEMGLIFMALAGYNPSEAPNFWLRMDAESKASGSQAPPQFLSTHPHHDTRVSHLNELMPIAMEVYKTKSIKPYTDYKKK
ncbi:MAG: M48 family metallopeptidase [Bacteroidota bacterium]